MSNIAVAVHLAGKQEMEPFKGGENGMTDRTIQLAFQLADSAAGSDIEILCAPAGGEPQTLEEIRTCWFDLHQIMDPADIPFVAKSVEYLQCRGLLNRHPVHDNWVRPRYEQPEPINGRTGDDSRD